MNTAGWIVAGYAALVSTASLLWQVVSWGLARSNRVKVFVRAALIGMSDGSMVDAVTVEAVNRSDHPVRVTGVGLYLQDGSGQQLHQATPFPGSSLPGTVPSHDSASTYFLAEEIKEDADIDLYSPITGWVQLSTGDQVKSKPMTPRSRN